MLFPLRLKPSILEGSFLRHRMLERGKQEDSLRGGEMVHYARKLIKLKGKQFKLQEVPETDKIL